MLFHDPWTVLVIMLGALALDRLLGEPWIYHPLVGFGRVATRLQSWLFRDTTPPWRQPFIGWLAVALAIGPLLAITLWLEGQVVIAQIMGVLVLYLGLGWRNLQEHCAQIQSALASKNLEAAREELGLLVNHNTRELGEDDLVNMAVETALEHGGRFVIGPLVWFAVLGGSGVVFYRLIVALASLWGRGVVTSTAYTRPVTLLYRYIERVTAEVVVFLFGLQAGLAKVRRAAQAGSATWDEPNVGRVIAAGAAVLQLQLRGGEVYGESETTARHLGTGPVARVSDIPRALKVIRGGTATLMWLTAALSVLLLVVRLV